MNLEVGKKYKFNKEAKILELVIPVNTKFILSDKNVIQLYDNNNVLLEKKYTIVIEKLPNYCISLDVSRKKVISDYLYYKFVNK